MVWNKKPYLEIKKGVEKYGYSLMTEEVEYRGVREKILVLDSDGYVSFLSFSTLENTIRRGYSPEKFNLKNPYALKNIRLWVEKNNLNIVLMSEKYFGAKGKLEFMCKKCESVFCSTWDSIYHLSLCPYCAGQKVNIKNSFGENNNGLLIDWDYESNKKTPYEYSKYSGEKVFWICSECNKKWTSKISLRVFGRGCPTCSSSKGEKKISEFLDNLRVQYVREKKFSDCRLKRVLPFDFYIEDINLAIEYMGIQHYEEIDFFSTEPLEYRQKKDNMKKKYCIDNNINYLDISYKDFDRIEEILSDIFTFTTKEEL